MKVRSARMRGPFPVAPVQSDHRPLWSVMVPTYNCASYLEETLRGVLEQDPGPELMQIEVVDDCSSDDPGAVVARIGGSRVGFYRQPSNVGHVRNFETCLNRARGRLIHLLHGDDVVLPGFYARLGEGLQRRPEAGAAFCRAQYIDEQGTVTGLSPLERPDRGLIEDWLATIASGQRVATPSVVVRRDVYERIGGFDARCLIAEDWEMWVRIAAHYPVWFEPEPLAVYRVRRAGALTQRTDTLLIEAVRAAAGIIAGYLPDRLGRMRARACLRSAMETYAGWALDHADGLTVTRGLGAAWPQLREALKCSRSMRVCLRAGRITLRGMTRALRRPHRRGAAA